MLSNVDMSAGIMDLKKVIYDNCNVSTGSGLKATISDSVTNLATSVSYLIQLFIPSLIGKLSNVVVSVLLLDGLSRMDYPWREFC